MRKSFLILVMLFAILGTACDFNSKADTPQDPFVILGRQYTDIQEQQGSGAVIPYKNGSVDKPMAIRYHQKWFGNTKRLKTDYLINPKTGQIEQITIYYPRSQKRDALVKNLNAYLGPVRERKINPKSSSVYSAQWIKGGAQYDMQDYGKRKVIYITTAKFPLASKYKLPANTIIVQEISKDLNNDGHKDKLMLLGQKYSNDSLFMKQLYIFTGAPKPRVVYLPKSADSGYDPYIKAVDFTGDKIPEVFVGMNAGGNAGINRYLVLTPNDNFKKPIFDSTKTVIPSFSGEFTDHYKAILIIKNSGKKFSIDLRERKKLYDDAGLYNRDFLLKDVILWGNEYSLVLPIDTDKDNVYDLHTIQVVKGINSKDKLATIKSVLGFKKSKWVIKRINVQQLTEEPQK